MKLTPAAQAQIKIQHEKLLQVRASKTVALIPTPMLPTEIVGFDKQTQPLTLRYYQCQGIYHLLTMKRMVLGDGTGLGKTLQRRHECFGPCGGPPGLQSPGASTLGVTAG